MNKIFDVFNKNWGNNLGIKWLEDNGIQKADYRNGEMNGNACKKLLEKLPKLRKDGPRRLKAFYEAFEAFNAVRKSCFGQILHASYKFDIEKFRKAYLKLNIPITNKVHLLVDHVPEFCERKQMGLGFFSEQAR